jgi:hypothetical protein
MRRMNYGQISCFDGVKTGTVFQTEAFYRYDFFEMLMTKLETTVMSVGQTRTES